MKISMDGRGRALDNVFVKRLWRSVKYEETYLKDYATVPLARTNLDAYFGFYNHRRPHHSLGFRTLAAVYAEAAWAAKVNHGAAGLLTGPRRLSPAVRR